MNLPVSRTLLSFALAFSLFSCNDDPTDIGLELQDQVNQIGTHFKDDLQINAATVLLKDSIVSFGSRPVLAGRMDDGDFGIVSARTFVEVGLPRNNLTFDTNTGADSLILSLGYSYYYGDTTRTTSLSVYELDERFDERTTYFTTSQLRIKTEPLGSVTFLPRPTGTIPTGGTANQRRIPTIKLKLSLELANRILAQSEQPALVNQQSFVTQLLKGISIEPTPGAPAGSVLGFALQSDSSYISLHYTATIDNAPVKRRVRFRFYDNNSQFNQFNQITADRSATPLAGLVNSSDLVASTETGNVAFLQSGTGLRTKITFPNLASLRSDASNIAINYAELVIPVKRDLFDRLPLPLQIALYETNESNRILRHSDGVTPRRVQVSGANPMGAGSPAYLTYDADNRQYKVNITSYLQAMLYGGKPNNGLLISSEINGNMVNRAVLNMSPTERIRLRVYYSLVN
jgi:hypothetical protein